MAGNVGLARSGATGVYSRVCGVRVVFGVWIGSVGMLAAILTDFNELVLEEVATPEPGMNEVVVRIRACGFCATDYKAIKSEGMSRFLLSRGMSRRGSWRGWGSACRM
jgi:hypothetical protein